MTQALILAAGFSTRLHPLTATQPKTLLPFLDRKLIDFTQAYLTHQGVTSIALNVHHGHESVLTTLKAYPDLTPFVENRILGTGGGIANMKRFIQTEDFVVINSDVLAELDLSAALAFHRARKSIATMVLVEDPRSHLYGEVGVDGTGRLVQFPHGPCPGQAVQTGVFIGIHIFRKDIFEKMPKAENFCINRDVYGPLIARGEPVFGYFGVKRWIDVGTLDAYARVQFDLLTSPFSWMEFPTSEYHQPEPGIWISKQAVLDATVRCHAPILVGPHARIGKNSVLGSKAIIGNGSEIGEKSQLQETIVFPELRLPDGTQCRECVWASNKTSIPIRRSSDPET